MPRRLLLVLSFLLLAALAVAQAPDLDPSRPARNPLVPTVTFTYELTGAFPSHYALVVESTGRAAYWSNSNEDETVNAASSDKPSSGDPNIERFVISQATAQNVFLLAKKLDFFNGKFDYTKTRIANTGAKTLIYGDPTRHFETTFNWSQTPEVMELARTFQAISSTLEFGRRLERHMHYEKLALDDDLKQLDEAAAHNDVGELQLIAPMLLKISKDNSVLHVARMRAQKLLEKAQPAAQ